MTALPTPRKVVFTLVLVLLLAGCTSPAPERQSLRDMMSQAQRAAEEAPASQDPSHDHDEDTGDPDPSPTATVPAGSDTDGGTTGTPSPSPAASPTATAAPADEGPAMEQHNDFPITATLNSACVERGGQITLTVESGHENTGVVYLAYYAGGESGAPPPYGDGHGGNGGDMVDDDGRYEDTWVVSAGAPVGPARVEVMVGRPGGDKSTAVVPFEVVDAGSGGCD